MKTGLKRFYRKDSKIKLCFRSKGASMFKVLLQIDEEQVKEDGEYNLSDIYKEVDDLYKETGCYLLEIEDNK